MLLHRAESLFEKGDKNGKLLSMLVVDQRAPVSVPCIRSYGEWVKDPETIMNNFVECYSGVYSPIPAYDETVFSPVSPYPL